jgi:hypothetical protein
VDYFTNINISKEEARSKLNFPTLKISNLLNNMLA